MAQQEPDASREREHAVEIDQVSKSYGPVIAVRNVTLPIRRGEMLTLLGPSGCGKTTLLNMIAGFEPPNQGRISIDGRDVTNVPPYLRETGMVFQNYALFPHMNVFDNIAFGLRMRQVDRKSIDREVGRALEMVKLSGLDKRRVKQLSGGQQQRVALARAIVFGPRVLLLDEPLSALDKNLRTQMQFELKELHRQTGLTTVFVTHDQGEALSLSDRIVVMQNGEIQQISAPIELYSRPVNAFVASFIGEINHLPEARCRVDAGRVHFDLPGGLTLSANGAAIRTDLRDRVHVFVRPEHISVVGMESAGLNVHRARIDSHIYQGTHTITRVQADGLGVLELRVEGGRIIEEHPAGSKVAIQIALDNAIVLPGASQP